MRRERKDRSAIGSHRQPETLSDDSPVSRPRQPRGDLAAAVAGIPRLVLVILCVQTFAVAALAVALVVRGGQRRIVRVVDQRVTVVRKPAPVPQSGVQTTVVKPHADGYVRAASPMSTYGHNAGLRVDGPPVARAYVRFSIPGGQRSIRRATLRVYPLTTSDSGVDVAQVDANWSESTLSYRTAPQP